MGPCVDILICLAIHAFFRVAGSQGVVGDVKLGGARGAKGGSRKGGKVVWEVITSTVHPTLPQLSSTMPVEPTI